MIPIANFILPAHFFSLFFKGRLIRGYTVYVCLLFNDLYVENIWTYLVIKIVNKIIMKTIKVREIEPRDQKSAFEIWKYGRTNDLGSLLFKYFMNKKQLQLSLFLILVTDILLVDQWIHLGLLFICGIIAFVHYYCRYYTLVQPPTFTSGMKSPPTHKTFRAILSVRNMVFRIF